MDEHVSRTGKVGNFDVLIPDGRIDGSNAKAVETALLELLDGADHGILIDFSEVAYISSAGLRVALVAAKRSANQNKVLRVYGLSDGVNHLFTMTGFNKIIDIRADQEAALRD